MAPLNCKEGQLKELLDLSLKLGSSKDLRESLDCVLAFVSAALSPEACVISLATEERKDGLEVRLDRDFPGELKELCEALREKAFALGSTLSAPITQSRHAKTGKDKLCACVPLMMKPSRAAGCVCAALKAGPDGPEASLRLIECAAYLLSESVSAKLPFLSLLESVRKERDALEMRLKGRLPMESFASSSSPMREVFRQIEIIAPTRAPALLRGEQGTPLEELALALHLRSGLPPESFAKIAASALPKRLLESGAGGGSGSSPAAPPFQDLMDASSIAEARTVYIDEVAELPRSSQLRLLELAQAPDPSPRMVASSSRDLEALVEDGSFGSDLFYRLNVLPIFVPPLRARKCDIPNLAARHIGRICGERSGRLALCVSERAMKLLMAHSWPGNDAELESCLEWAAARCAGQAIEEKDLPLEIQNAHPSGKDGCLEAAIARLEAEMVCDALKACAGNMSKAAEALGVTERVMGLRVRKYRIDPKSFK